MNLQYVLCSYFLIKMQLEMWSLNVYKILHFNTFSTMFCKQGSQNVTNMKTTRTVVISVTNYGIIC